MPMASKMVTNFRRSLSFPNNPSQTNSSKPRKPALHVRSTSLPACRSHPIISQLRDEISDLNSWSSSSDRTSAWLCDGLRRLKTLHESLDDLLHLPQTRESLRAGACADVIIEKLTEDFLRFVDVYGMFQTLVMRLKEEYSAAQIAVRMRRDHNNIDAKLFFAVHLKNLNKTAKEIGKLVSNFGSIGKLPVVCPSTTAPYDEEAELIEVINEVLKITVSVSGLLFGGLSTSSAFRKPASCMPAGLSNLGRKRKNPKLVEGGIREFEEINFEINYLRKKLGEEEVKMMSKKMHEMEDCIVEIDGCGERAFRSLINTRVSLLNVNVVTQ